MLLTTRFSFPWCRTEEFLRCLRADNSRLGHGDGVDEESNATLGNDVRAGVSKLDGNNDVAAGDAEHRKNVDNWIGAPRDDGCLLRKLDEAANNRVLLGFGGGGKSHQERVHDVDERDHGCDPVQPAGSELVLVEDEFYGASEDDHESGGNSEGEGLA